MMADSEIVFSCTKMSLSYSRYGKIVQLCKYFPIGFHMKLSPYKMSGMISCSLTWIRLFKIVVIEGLFTSLNSPSEISERKSMYNVTMIFSFKILINETDVVINHVSAIVRSEVKFQFWTGESLENNVKIVWVLVVRCGQFRENERVC